MRIATVVLIVGLVGAQARAQVDEGDLVTGSTLVGVGSALVVVGSIQTAGAALSGATLIFAGSNGVPAEALVPAGIGLGVVAVVSLGEIIIGSTLLGMGRDDLRRSVSNTASRRPHAGNLPMADRDRLPARAEPETPKACTPGWDCPLDTDADGIDNAKDRCPDVSGPADNGGCPSRSIAPADDDDIAPPF